MEWHAAPLPDLAPALNADMPRHLRLLRKRAQFVYRPRRSVVDEAGQFKLPVRGRFPDLPFLVIRIEAEWPGHSARWVGLREARAREQRRLYPVVEAQHAPEGRVYAGMGRQAAASQERQ